MKEIGSGTRTGTRPCCLCNGKGKVRTGNTEERCLACLGKGEVPDTDLKKVMPLEDFDLKK